MSFLGASDLGCFLIAFDPPRKLIPFYFFTYFSLPENV